MDEDEEEHLFWVSMCDETRAPGDRFVGVFITKTCCPHHASGLALAAGADEDWDCRVAVIPETQYPEESLWNRILTFEETEVAAAQVERKSQGTPCNQLH